MRKLTSVGRAHQDRRTRATWVAFAALAFAGCEVGVEENNFFAPPSLGDDASSSTSALDTPISATWASSTATSATGAETSEGTATTGPLDTGDGPQESGDETGSSGSESGGVGEGGAFPRGTTTWRGVYLCSQGETTLELTLTHTTVDGHLEGVFGFAPTPSNPEIAEGSFSVSGSHTSADGTVDLIPGAWIDQPDGWSTISLSGTFDPLTMTISGDVLEPDCSMFDVELE